MGKPPFNYADSETEETSCSSSLENMKKKKKFSILRFTNSNSKKKKFKAQSKSEPDDLEIRSNRSRSSQKVKNKLQGILKNSNYNHTERIYSSPEDEDESDQESLKPFPQSRYLVGSVPRPIGSKPGRGGGVALIVRKNVSSLQSSDCSTKAPKKTKSSTKRLSRKKSY